MRRTTPSQRRHAVHSISKSFTAMAVGYAIEVGLLGLDDRVIDLLPDHVPEHPDPRLARLTLRHLLTMTAGRDTDTLAEMSAAGSTEWLRDMLAWPFSAEPGAVFHYDSGATFLAGVAVARAMDQGLLELLRPRLLDPLGIRDARWDRSPDGWEAGGTGLAVRTEELAAFGELMRNRGRLDGAAVVPAGWMDAATARQVDNRGNQPKPDWQQGYGYQFWRARHGTFRADGAFGQFVVVLPEQDAVLVTTAAQEDMQAMLDLAWDRLLPAFDAGVGGAAAADARLAATLAALRHPTRPDSVAPPPGPMTLRTIGPGIVRAVTVTPEADGAARLDLATTAGPVAVRTGPGRWIADAVPLFGAEGTRVASSGGWTGPLRWSGVIRPLEGAGGILIDLDATPAAPRLDVRCEVQFGDPWLARGAAATA